MNFRTKDLPQAAVLSLRKHQLLHVDHGDQHRVYFEFKRTAALEKDLQDLQTGQIKVDPIEFWFAIKRCKQLIYGPSI